MIAQLSYLVKINSIINFNHYSDFNLLHFKRKKKMQD
jgi:hypothetical protein